MQNAKKDEICFFFFLYVRNDMIFFNCGGYSKQIFAMCLIAIEELQIFRDYKL